MKDFTIYKSEFPSLFWGVVYSILDGELLGKYKLVESSLADKPLLTPTTKEGK